MIGLGRPRASKMRFLLGGGFEEAASRHPTPLRLMTPPPPHLERLSLSHPKSAMGRMICCEFDSDCCQRPEPPPPPPPRRNCEVICGEFLALVGERIAGYPK